MAISSNLHPAAFDELMPKTLATATVDRLLHHAQRQRAGSGDSAYGNTAVAGAARKAGARFSLGIARNAAVDRAIASIPETAWKPVNYPGAVLDPDTGELISDAQVAETQYTMRPGTGEEITARLVVRRVRDRARTGLDEQTGELFPVWRHHPFFTDADTDTANADITHRQHAVIETVFADLIDGPLAHLPSGRFAANAPGQGVLRA